MFPSALYRGLCIMFLVRLPLLGLSGRSSCPFFSDRLIRRTSRHVSCVPSLSAFPRAPRPNTDVSHCVALRASDTQRRNLMRANATHEVVPPNVTLFHASHVDCPCCGVNYVLSISCSIMIMCVSSSQSMSWDCAFSAVKLISWDM